MDPNRIEQIAVMLPTKPRSLGDPIPERKRRDVLREHPSLVWGRRFRALRIMNKKQQT
ncbi:MAG: hypothetical protein P1V20_04950 [Verrucomicrobiales bacterium]|nr:hypothetical protein [Verrucomicrobiales bacterium]